MKNTTKIRILIALTTGLSAYTAWSAKAPLTTNGVNWGVNYYDPDAQSGDRYDKLPNDPDGTFPVWTAEYNTGSYTLNDSYLRISTAAGKRQSFSTKSNWDLTGNTTVEAVVRIVSQSGKSGAGSIVFGNANFYGTVLISADSIGKCRHDFTQWTTVRLVFENMHDMSSAVVKVYLDHNPSPVLTSKTWTAGSTINLLRFGDPNTASTDGTVEWDSIRWTSAGAFAPVGP
jgi:hypothetical protein